MWAFTFETFLQKINDFMFNEPEIFSYVNCGQTLLDEIIDCLFMSNFQEAHEFAGREKLIGRDCARLDCHFKKCLPLGKDRFHNDR